MKLERLITDGGLLSLPQEKDMSICFQIIFIWIFNLMYQKKAHLAKLMPKGIIYHPSKQPSVQAEIVLNVKRKYLTMH